MNRWNCWSAARAGSRNLAKPFGDEVLSNAIDNSIERSRTALGQEAKIREIRDSYASLSRRERQFIALVVCGRLNKQVGGVLVIIVSPTWATPYGAASSRSQDWRVSSILV